MSNTKVSKKYPPTPELDKLKEVAPFSQKIGEFVDVFMCERGFTFGKPHVHDSRCPGWDERRNKYNPSGDDRCSFQSGEFESCGHGITKLLAEFFEIDDGKCEKERCAVLEHIQEVQGL